MKVNDRGRRRGHEKKRENQRSKIEMEFRNTDLKAKRRERV